MPDDPPETKPPRTPDDVTREDAVPGGAVFKLKRSTTGGLAGYQRVGLVLGPAIALLILLMPAPEGLSTAGWRAAALGLWMATWWATEAVPVAATALLPIAVFPLLGIADIKSVTAPYANKTIYLFLGGFMVAFAVQRWGLHRRIALAVIAVFGGTGASLVGGFMLASALLSMWVTNTSTTMMLLPIAVSVVALVQQNLPNDRDAQDRFPRAMLLGVAGPLLARLDALSGISDAGLAVLAAVMLFLVPSGDGKSMLLRWGDTSELPWGLLILFGGGLTLAAAVSATGLAEWLGRQLIGLQLTQLAILVVAVTALIIFLTELTSNLATTATFLPVVAAVAVESDYAPIALTAPVALAASCAFMLPVATPPNAVIYGSGMLSIPDMVRAGFWLNVIGIVLVSVVAVVLAPLVLS